VDACSKQRFERQIDRPVKDKAEQLITNEQMRRWTEHFKEVFTNLDSMESYYDDQNDLLSSLLSNLEQNYAIKSLKSGKSPGLANIWRKNWRPVPCSLWHQKINMNYEIEEKIIGRMVPLWNWRVGMRTAFDQNLCCKQADKMVPV
jgi:hypothetical protein